MEDGGVFFSDLTHDHLIDVENLWTTSSDVSGLHHLWYLKIIRCPE
jgi:hypothetical protein